jgi:hypothetical protein
VTIRRRALCTTGIKLLRVLLWDYVLTILCAGKDYLSGQWDVLSLTGQCGRFTSSGLHTSVGSQFLSRLIWR